MTTYIEIWQRFSQAWEIATSEYGSKKEVADACNIPLSNLTGAIKSAKERKLKIEWVATLCVHLGISVEYVMTGRGKMFK